MSFRVDEEVAMLSRTQAEKQRLLAQEKELAGLPKAINVTYIGSDLSGYSHKGRSRQRSNDPYRFYQNIPIKITIPVDIKYFLNRANPSLFKVEIVNVSDLEVKQEVKEEVIEPKAEVVEETKDAGLDPEYESQKELVEKIMEEQKQVEEVPEEEVQEEIKEEESSSEALEETGLSLKIRNRIVEAGYDSLEKIANAKIEDLIEIEGVGQVTAEKIQSTAVTKLGVN